jgi:hypothetical protein
LGSVVAIAAALLVVTCGCADDSADDGGTDRAGSGPGRREDGGPSDAAADGDGRAPDDAAPPDAAAVDARQDPEPIVGSDYVDFGALQPTETGIVQVQLDVPDDALSFVLTADPGAVPRDLALLALYAPSGELLYEATADMPQPFDPATAQSGSEQLPYAWMLPSSPELALEPGRYRIALYVGAPALSNGNPGAPDGGPGAAGGDAPAVRGGPVQVDAVLARGRDGDPPRPLSLVFWSVEGAALDAQAVAADPQLNEALTVARELFAAAGLELARAHPSWRASTAMPSSPARSRCWPSRQRPSVRWTCC